MEGRRQAKILSPGDEGTNTYFCPAVDRPNPKMPAPTNNSGLRDNHTRGTVADFLREKSLVGSQLPMNPLSERRFPRLPLAKADAGASPGERFLRAKGPAPYQPRATPWVNRLSPHISHSGTPSS